jgi:hypothetical protein
MKHVKLFETFSSTSTPPQLIVHGDWTGILVNPDKSAVPFDGEFIAPATFYCEYRSGEKPIHSGYRYDAEKPLYDLEDIAEEVFGGDQNGVNVAPKDYRTTSKRGGLYDDARRGIVRIYVVPSLDPSEIESYLKNKCSKIWGAGSPGSEEEYYSISDLYPDVMFEPDYMKSVKAGRSFPRKVVFTNRSM